MKKELKELRKPLWELQLIMIGTVVIAALCAIFIPYGWIASILITIFMGYFVIRKKIFETIMKTYERAQFFRHNDYVHWSLKNSKEEIDKVIKFLSDNELSINDMKNGVLMTDKFRIRYWPYCSDNDTVNCHLELFRDESHASIVSDDTYLYKDEYGEIQIKNFNNSQKVYIL